MESAPERLPLSKPDPSGIFEWGPSASSRLSSGWLCREDVRVSATNWSTVFGLQLTTEFTPFLRILGGVDAPGGFCGLWSSETMNDKDVLAGGGAVATFQRPAVGPKRTCSTGYATGTVTPPPGPGFRRRRQSGAPKALVSSTGFKTYRDGFPPARSETCLPVSQRLLPACHTRVTTRRLTNQS